ncbi:hypothetical protein ES288_A13G199400v1, partial [Gossypium darwinii]
IAHRRGSTFPKRTPRWPTSQISRRRGSVTWSSARFGSLARVVSCLDSKLAAPISFCCWGFGLALCFVYWVERCGLGFG